MGSLRLNSFPLYAYGLFAILFYGELFLFGFWSDKNVKGPMWILASRDVFWMFLMIYCWRIRRYAPDKLGVGNTGKVIIFAQLAYLMVASTHFGHKSSWDILQFDFRDIILYATILWALPIYLPSRQQIRQYFRWIVRVSAIAGLLGIASMLDIDKWGYAHRVQSTLGHPNIFGYIMLLPMLYYFYLSVKTERLIYGAITVLMVDAIILSGSLAAIAMLGIGLLVTLFMCERRPWRYFSKVLILFLVNITILYNIGLLNEFVTNRIAGLVQLVTQSELLTSTKKTTVSGRYRQVMDLANFWYNYPQYIWFGDYSTAGHYRYDSGYCTILRNNGLIGLGALILSVLICWWQFVKRLVKIL